MQGVILAAGWGKRLRPITLRRSKAMAPVLGKPIVERVMEGLVAQGVDDFVVVASPDDRKLAHHFEQASELQARVRIVHQRKRLGMAHALNCAAPLIGGNFVLSACDNLVATDQIERLMAAWQQSPRPSALLTLMPVEPEQVSKGAVVDMEGRWITRIVEKPRPEEAISNIYSLPLYCFTPRILDYLSQVPRSPRGEYELQDAIQMLIEGEGRVSGVIIPGRLTLTEPQDLLTINQHYLENSMPPIHFAPRALGQHTHLIPPLHVNGDTVIGRNCTIGPNAYVEEGCRIGRGVTLRNAVVLGGTEVPDGATIRDRVVGPAGDHG
ncbi:MAG: sugar phosphate nucleotidyltransferase [Anaerolineae bacterium]|jgi:NDP-sugar pyrophosphorylase family protein